MILVDGSAPIAIRPPKSGVWRTTRWIERMRV
jgi:hypothetical protein